MRSNYEKIREQNIREYGEGTRHLSYLGHLYSDRTHFLFELLQNAEDEGATKVLFDLHRDHLEFLHDGKPFDEADVRGICGVGVGTKQENLTKIGRFGIGFKSVYAYTAVPEVHCGTEHFRIEHYVRPYAISVESIPAPWTTRFRFPFSAEVVPPGIAYQEVLTRLRRLNARTMLFLRNIREIQWKTASGSSGLYLRHSEKRGLAHQVTVVGQSAGESEEDEVWLLFNRPVTGPNGAVVRPVEVAYALVQEQHGSKPKALRIVPLHHSPLVVFFPTEKITGLGFLIQGPYRTTPARDNIPKDDQWNRYLIAETAALVIDSLRTLKKMGLLSVDVLEAMPIDAEEFPEHGMFRPIFEALRDVLRTEELIPREGGDFIAGQDAKMGRGAEIRALLNPEQLAELFGSASEKEQREIYWITGEITQERSPTLRNYLTQQVGIQEIVPEDFARRVSDEFLIRQSDAWMTELYKFLLRQEALWRATSYRGSTDGPLRHKRFIRLEDGGHERPFRADGSPNVYLPQRDGIGAKTVKRSLLADQGVREFFAKLGIREPDIVSAVLEEVLPHYEPDEIQVTEEQHAYHFALIMRALRVDSLERKRLLIERLKGCYFVLARNASSGEVLYCRPTEVYLPTADLQAYFEGNDECWFLDEPHSEDLIAALMELGLSDKVRTHVRPANDRGYVHLNSGWGLHRRGLNGFDPECWVDGLDHALTHPSFEKSLFIWRHIVQPLQGQIRGTVEKATRQSYENSERAHTTSKMGELLVESAWLPDSTGNAFFHPRDISLAELPDELEKDEGIAGRLGMKDSDLIVLARKANVEVSDIELARELREMPDEYARIKALVEKRRNKPVFPERPSADPDRRRKRAREAAREAPSKRFEERTRSFRISAPLGDKNTYLRESYTNEDQKLVCQMCEEEMPFRKRDDEYYFEAVQLFDDLAAEHAAAHVALCPLCAAKYKELVKRDEEQISRFRDRVMGSDEQTFVLDLAGEPGHIRFVERHLIEVQELLSAEDSGLTGLAATPDLIA